MNIKNMTLCKLAVAGIMFNSLTRYNKSLALLRHDTANRIDLNIPEHCNALMKWLNDWGCRHLPENQHQVASQSILEWYQTESSTLFSDKKPLWELTDQDLEIVAHAYGSLKDKTGARRFRNTNYSEVHIGATAASKILFAIRPKAIMPWDDAMRKSFVCDGSPLSYSKYMNMIRQIASHLDNLCREKGFRIDELPDKIGRSGSTLLELINEYLWVTVTRKVKLPSSEILMQWASLG